MIRPLGLEEEEGGEEEKWERARDSETLCVDVFCCVDDRKITDRGLTQEQ